MGTGGTYQGRDMGVRDDAIIQAGKGTSQRARREQESGDEKLGGHGDVEDGYGSVGVRLMRKRQGV